MIKCTILQNHKKYYYYSVKVDIIEYFYGKGGVAKRGVATEKSYHNQKFYPNFF